MIEEEVAAVEEEAIEEPSEEGGASKPNKVGKQGPERATIAAKSATVRRSAEERKVSRLRQVDNLQTTPTTPNTRITADYS